MRKIMNIFFLSCLRATELMEKKLHFRLNRVEKIQLRMHTMMCDACPRYEDQTEIIEKGIASAQREELSDSELEQLKTLISKRLEDLNK